MASDHQTSHTQLSAEIQRLLSQLAQQHLKELAILRAQESRERRPNPRPTSNGLNPRPTTICLDDSRGKTGSLQQAVGDDDQSVLNSKGAADEMFDAEEMFEGKFESVEAEDSFVYDRKHKQHLLTEDVLQAVAQANEEEPLPLPPPSMSWYMKTRMFLCSPIFEWSMMLLLGLNIVFMGIELQYEGLIQGHKLGYGDMREEDADKVWQGASTVFTVIDRMFTCLFLIDALSRMFFLGKSFWREVMNYVDIIVVVASLIELVQSLLVPPAIIRLIRLGKLVRTLKMVKLSASFDTLQLILRCIVSSVHALFWSLVILIIIQCVSGMIISNVTKSTLADGEKDLEDRQDLWARWGTFTRMSLSMFEILFANWAPVARQLVEQVDESFIFVFLFYRCFVGFAVLNVVNAVFVQQTMKVVHSDEGVLAEARQREKDKYAKKLKQAFSALDTSGDGFISRDEYDDIMHSDSLHFLMGQLEIETTDLTILFDLLDDGDGEISINEFTDGVAMLKGQARNIDVMRLLRYSKEMSERLVHLETALGVR